MPSGPISGAPEDLEVLDVFQRIMVAVVFIPLIFLVFYFFPPIALPIAISILSMIALHEVLWSTGFVKNRVLSTFSIILSGLIPFWVFYEQDPLWARVVLFAYFALVFITAISSNYSITMEKLGGSFFFATLIPYFLSSFIRLDQLDGYSKVLILTPLVAAFASDTFAYFGGMLFGKHKLAPELSPKKTVEGAVSGLVGATVCMVVYGLVMGHFFSWPMSLPLLALYGALGAVVAQLGDLSFSYIKRQYGLKDFGYIFPGHGGVLDRFDSVIFCAPLIEILWQVLPAVQLP